MLCEPGQVVQRHAYLSAVVCVLKAMASASRSFTREQQDSITGPSSLRVTQSHQAFQELMAVARVHDTAILNALAKACCNIPGAGALAGRNNLPPMCQLLATFTITFSSSVFLARLIVSFLSAKDIGVIKENVVRPVNVDLSKVTSFSDVMAGVRNWGHVLEILFDASAQFPEVRNVDVYVAQGTLYALENGKPGVPGEGVDVKTPAAAIVLSPWWSTSIGRELVSEDCDNLSNCLRHVDEQIGRYSGNNINNIGDRLFETLSLGNTGLNDTRPGREPAPSGGGP